MDPSFRWGDVVVERASLPSRQRENAAGAVEFGLGGRPDRASRLESVTFRLNRERIQLSLFTAFPEPSGP
jgi:hypothetical protein